MHVYLQSKHNQYSGRILLGWSNIFSNYIVRLHKRKERFSPFTQPSLNVDVVFVLWKLWKLFVQKAMTLWQNDSRRKCVRKRRREREIERENENVIEDCVRYLQQQFHFDTLAPEFIDFYPPIWQREHITFQMGNETEM